MGVVVQDLEKIYVDPHTAEEVVAIRGLNLELKENEFTSIVGPSGCGKTTFLHMVAGLRKITRGKILVNGKLVTRPGADRGVVFHYQNAFHGFFSSGRRMVNVLPLPGSLSRRISPP